MTAGIKNFIIEQGATFSHILTWKDEGLNLVNLTGYTARMQMRVRHNSTTNFINLTTENNGITLGGIAGTITLTISDSATSAITEEIGVYDLELIAPDSTVTRLLQGKITISKEVTK